MRLIDSIIVHCSATRPEQDIGVDEIRTWHLQRGWSDVGYHYIIRRDGGLEVGRPLDRAGAHARGNNATSIGICLVGGIGYDMRPDANFTVEQYRELDDLLHVLADRFSIDNTKILGHRDLEGVTKACPCFDVQAFWVVRG